MKLHTITHKTTGAVLFEDEAACLYEVVAAAINENVSLRGANLEEIDLDGTDLDSADLRSADLSGADLSGATLRNAEMQGAELRRADLKGADLKNVCLHLANLREANLCGALCQGSDLKDADFRGANLRGANLSFADLTGSDLAGADLTGAVLTGANLRFASLTGAKLADANLSDIRQDFLEAVAHLPAELPFLRQTIIDGKIDGSSYHGDCACLAGTLARARGIEDYDGEPIGSFQADYDSPREKFFLGIAEGETPETNQLSALALAWTEEAIEITKA